MNKVEENELIIESIDLKMKIIYCGAFLLILILIGISLISKWTKGECNLKYSLMILMILLAIYIIYYMYITTKMMYGCN